MKLLRGLPTLLLSALAALPLHAFAAEGRVIVKFRADSQLAQAQSAAAGARPQHAQAMGRRLGLALADGHALGARTQALRGRDVDSATLARRLAALPEVEWAVVDRRRQLAGVTPNDPLYRASSSTSPAVGQWYLRAPSGSVKASIDALGAWSMSWGSSSVTVAVLDTGVRFDHPDLRHKLWPGYDFVDDLPTAADGDGRDADASDPGDGTTSADGCGESGSSWHGTQVAGLVAASTDNGAGMAGTARNVMVLPVRVLGKCGGYDSDILAGMRWAGGLAADPVVNRHPARILNMSLGAGGACSAAYRETVAELAAAGVVVVAAAGNEAGVAVIEPANCPGVIAVAGVRHVGTKVGYSNVGPEVAVAAPAGNCVNLSGECLYPLLTTVNLGVTGPAANGYSDGSNYSVGTSFGTPLVAGTAALMLSVNPSLTPAQLRSLIRSTAREFPTTGGSADTPQCRAPDGRAQEECYCTTSTCGAGMLDAAAAVAAAVPVAGPPPLLAASASASRTEVGQTVTLSAAATAAATRTVSGYAWRVRSGSAAIVGSANAASVTLRAEADGDVIAEVTSTDSAGAKTARTVGFRVGADPVSGGSGGDTGGGGGGGGAFAAGWLAALALAAAALSGRGRRAR